jgi:hypothetical protein
MRETIIIITGIILCITIVLFLDSLFIFLYYSLKKNRERKPLTKILITTPIIIVSLLLLLIFEPIQTTIPTYYIVSLLLSFGVVPYSLICITYGIYLTIKKRNGAKEFLVRGILWFLFNLSFRVIQTFLLSFSDIF